MLHRQQHPHDPSYYQRHAHGERDREQRLLAADGTRKGGDMLSYERMLYRNQFILGPRFVDWLPKWKKFELNGATRLTVHPDLPCCQVSEGSRSITLLGFILDPDDAKATDQEIVGRLLEALRDCESFFEQTYKYGGRWVLIVSDGKGRVLFNDAAGLRQAFYSNEQYGNGFWCASEPGMLARVLHLEMGTDALDLINSYSFRRNKEYWWPGSGSPYKEINHLLPNHFLDLRNGRVRRYWPDRDLKERPIGEVVETVSKTLMGLIRSAVERFDLVQSITGGWDSRLLLAATREVSHRISYMTVRQLGMRESHADIRIPLALARKLGLEYNVVRSSLIMDPEFVKTFKTNAVLAHDHYAPDAQAILNHYGLAKVCMVGSVSELARTPEVLQTRRWINGGITPIEMLAELYDIGKHRYAVAEIEKWCAGVGDIHNLDWGTVFHWEQRIANWLAMTQLEFDTAWRDTFSPYNCRDMLMEMLAVRGKDRWQPHNRLYKELIRNLWPEVLSEPVNPHKAGLANMKGKLRAEVKRLIMRIPQLRRRFEQGE
jgi:hypothetical protein